MRILATSVNPLFADLDEEIDPKLVDLYLNDAWYQETFKDFKVEKQTLGHWESGKIQYSSEFGVTDSLFYGDAEDYSAYHMVGPDFGCIHFKEKEDAGKK